MNWLRSNSLFAAVLILSAGAVTWEGWTLHGAWQRTTHAETTLRQRKDEHDWLARRQPALSAENNEALAADVGAAERRLAELREALRGRGRWLSETPLRPIEAYFDLASFNEKMRALALRQQVALRADERFGFATYAGVGPTADQLASVHRQRVLVEHLVEALLEARPRSLLAVQRERPRLSATPSGVNGSAAAAESRAGEEAADFFEPDARVRLRVPGVVDTEAFRVEFTGQTQSLRAFLNGLASFKLPLIVRAVEVEPVPGEATASSGAGTGAPVPLVPQNFSKFAVVLEFVELPPVPSSVPSP